ncbi:hypothetical protein EJB05_56262, partial [Eragrostis curvula]
MAQHSSRTGDLEGSFTEQESRRRRLEAAEEAVVRWGPLDAAVGLDTGGGSRELEAAVRELIALSSDGGVYGHRAKVALQTAMAHLEDEFRQVLISGTIFHPPGNLQESLHDNVVLPARSFSFSSFPNFEAQSISSFSTTPTDDSQTYCAGFSRDSVSMEELYLYLIDPEASLLLKDIAELFILAGHAPKLCHVFSEIRQNSLMLCLYLLGVHIKPNVHSPLAAPAEGGYDMEIDGSKVKLWIKGLKIIVGTVLPEERQFCAQIFGCDKMVEQDCFTRATTRVTEDLLAFGSAIAKVKKYHYEKVPLLLQMHEELAKVQPNLQVLLSGDAKVAVCQKTSMLLDKLREASLCLLLEFLKLQFDSKPEEKTALDGSILSMTQFVMSFVKLLAEYSDSINLILTLKEEEAAEGGGRERTISPWEQYARKLLSHLQLKIVEKSESYKDECLRYIFLMNNAMYVLEYSRSSVLSMSLRDEWIYEQLVFRVEKYATAYFRASWSSALRYLKFNGQQFTQGKRGHNSLKETFKSFNSAFKEIIRVQTTWKVPNPQLRLNLRIIILQHVLPAYRAYWKMHGCLVDAGRNSEKCIKYTPDDIVNHVLDLFEG